jgi:prefoldin beta subunit
MTEKDDIVQFQQLQQQMQMLLMQKQNLQIQGSEITVSLSELETLREKEIFEVVGNILIKKPKEDVQKRLKEKEETINLRASTIDKQIEKLSEKAKALQEKLSKNIK